MIKLKINIQYCTKSDCYKSGKTIKVSGLMLHSVGASQPNAESWINRWNKAGNNVCPHGVIDATENVYLTLPCMEKSKSAMRGWHGGGSSNNTMLGFEMTEPSSIKYTSGANFVDNDPEKTKAHVLATYKTAVELFTKLCEFHKLEPSCIISHSEGYKKGVASNHADVEHLWKRFGLTMDQFRADVQTKLNSFPYLVKITASVLNVRNGAGIEYKINTTVKKGEVYTIVAEQSGWGKLKSGAGWISLKYTERRGE